MCNLLPYFAQFSCSEDQSGKDNVKFNILILMLYTVLLNTLGE